jgi:glycerophosphoryl diester phosphodiesterase
MKKKTLLLPALFTILTTFAVSANACDTEKVEVGVRPYYLVDKMDESPLKKELQSCEVRLFQKSDFSIGHRGAGLQFPEHTRESYIAAARMGAGIVECDVTFTKDKELVCRHSQCDLHATTNILLTPLAEKCTQNFIPYDEATGTKASAKCCTSDITVEEFKTLKGKMDSTNPKAKTVEAYVHSTPSWRTDLYAPGTVMTHKESIALFKKLGVKMTPELKTPSVPMPYEGMTQEDYAQKMLDEYREAHVSPCNVFAQSFNYSDIRYWIKHDPEFGRQAVYLDGRAYGETKEDQELFAGFDPNNAGTWGSRDMEKIVKDGVRYIAPPMWVLVTLDANNKIVPSAYAKAAKCAGLNIITWTLERSGPLKNGGGWYYQTIKDAIDGDGDMYTLLDVLAQKVGIKGIFSDWPATVTFYANCKGL